MTTTKSLKLHCAQWEMGCLMAEMLETLAVFRADFAGRKARYESHTKSYLSAMNNDLGYVEEREDIWYSADEQRYMPLMSAVSWKAEMDGYSIFDPGDCEVLWAEEMEESGHGQLPKVVTDYQETPSREPGARSEIMNVFAPLSAGPYRETFLVDPDILSELMDNGVDLLSALKWSTDCYHYENSAGGMLDPLEVGYDPNVEDQAMLIDLGFSRGYCDAADSWDGYQDYLKELAHNGPKGICPDRARYMRAAAEDRNTRFIKELNFIASASPKAVRSRYAWAKDPGRRGVFWRTVDKYHANNPEPGLTWLTRSHTILVNFAYRRRLGIKVSDGLAKSAVYAADNVAEQMKKHCDIDQFNLADVEGHICGHTEYFEYLGKYYAERQG